MPLAAGEAMVIALEVAEGSQTPSQGRKPSLLEQGQSLTARAVQPLVAEGAKKEESWPLHPFFLAQFGIQVTLTIMQVVPLASLRMGQSVLLRPAAGAPPWHWEFTDAQTFSPSDGVTLRLRSTVDWSTPLTVTILVSRFHDNGDKFGLWWIDEKLFPECLGTCTLPQNVAASRASENSHWLRFASQVEAEVPFGACCSGSVEHQACSVQAS